MMPRRSPSSFAAGLLAAATLCVVAFAPSAAAAPERQLGGETVGAQIDPLTTPSVCDRLRSDGSRASAVFLTRSLIERNDGSLNVAAIENRVGPQLACGIELGVRVRPTTMPDQDSYLPRGAELTSYLGLLTQLAAYLDGRVERYAIDNETAAQGHFDGSADEYFELLRVSAASIRAGDPDAEIVDGTMASGSMTAVMVADLYGQGRYDDALALAQETQANELGGGRPVRDREDLAAYVADPRVQRSIEFFYGAVANQGDLDAFQLHYYGPWRSMVDMFDFARTHGITVPIEAWELNHRYRDGRPFDEREHADEVARLVLTAAGEGSSWTVFSSYLGSAENDAYGLLDFAAAGDHLARFSFRSVAERLDGATTAQRLELDGGGWGYRFERPQGDVVAAWADPAPAAIGDELGLNATTAAVGEAGTGDIAHVRLSRLRLGATPSFLTPDLVEVQRAGGPPRRRAKRVRLRLSCPEASVRRSCKGRVKVTRGGGRTGGRDHGERRLRSLGRKGFRVARGESERLRVRLERRGRATRATAVTRPCRVHGKGGCRSWTRLR